METTIRFHMNPDEVNLSHNTNAEVRSRENHIKADPKTGHTLEIWCSNYSSPEEAIADILSDDLEAYNKKQSHKKRRMTMEQYIQSVKDDKRGKGHKVKYKKSDGTTGYRREKREQKRLAYEVIFSCGNTDYETDEFGKARYDSHKRHIRPHELPYEVNYAVCKRYFETFETRNPNFKIMNCVWHNDEGGYNTYNIWEYGTPHPHLSFVPIAAGYKQGLARQVSIGHALMNMGYADTKEDFVDEDGKTKSRTVCAYTLWERNEAKYLEDLLQEEYSKYCKKNKAYAKKHGKLEIIHPVQGRNAESLAPKEYAQKQRLLEEIADISAQLEEKLEQLSALSRVEIKAGKKFLSSKVRHYMSEDEYNALLQAREKLEKMTANLIAGDEYLKKAKKESEAAEKKYKAADELYRNEERHIQEQAERRAVQIAENHKKDLDEDYKAKYKNIIYTYNLMRIFIRETTGKTVSTVLKEYFPQKKLAKLRNIIQNMDISQINNINLPNELER